MMRTALQWGVKHRYIKENVADFADKPAHVRYQGAEPYTIQEIASLLSCTQMSPLLFQFFWLLFMACGALKFSACVGALLFFRRGL